MLFIYQNTVCAPIPLRGLFKKRKARCALFGHLAHLIASGQPLRTMDLKKNAAAATVGMPSVAQI